ncbi:hypothetical protein IW261DRAFT_1609218 [Armillaria novae-zelandiae]|uniref:Zn(2)-C6 fungal-type domain-containing protein n=1 Tax=Armillaria novae-zelandiae TaxID=153914 RepID=A0AA39TB12_9AGAR|nr:hypothetical protein IW262DRAFT_1464819 [Armillaria fumosa]KAK0477041.1 hypothetical protein IW261DRAFT_1609218 [Armillaria novae-zelandiae]
MSTKTGSSAQTNQQQYDDNTRVPRRTPMACQFCRGRKLKCDGSRPSCANCGRRQIACTYQPVNAGQ